MVSDKTRREAFITQNLGLVHACAGRFRGRGIEYDDLYGAGCMGLVKACDNFDPERGVCFSTYAVPVILGEIKKLFREGGTVKVSRSLKELGMRVQAAREHTMKLCGTEPTLSQLAEQLGESVENVAMAIQAAQRHEPDPVGPGGCGTSAGYPGGIPGGSTGGSHQSGRGAPRAPGAGPSADPAAVLRQPYPERDRKGAAYHPGTDLPAGA